MSVFQEIFLPGDTHLPIFFKLGFSELGQLLKNPSLPWLLKSNGGIYWIVFYKASLAMGWCLQAVWCNESLL